MNWLLGGRVQDPAIVTDGATLTHGDLSMEAASFSARYLADTGTVVLIVASTTLKTIVAYIAVHESDSTAIVVDENLDDSGLSRVVAVFEPDVIVGTQGAPVEGYLFSEPGVVVRKDWRARTPIRAKLVVLTSGSVGAPKGVALSGANLRANTSGIITRLGIDATCRGVTALPLNYSFGLSVLHTHFAAGGSILLTRDRASSRRFWKVCATSEVTHLATVPLPLQLMKDAVGALWPESLRQIAQSGGRMGMELKRFYLDLARERDASYFLMYGQTEVSTRATAFDATCRPDKLGSVGRPLDDTRVYSLNDELVVESEAVMQGYVDSASSLAAVGRPNGVGIRRTGDLGEIDDEGFVWLRGRASRVVKVAGRRVGLEEIEEVLGDDAAVTSTESGIVLHFAGNAAPDSRTAITELARAMSLPPSVFSVRHHDAVPRTARGKIDYRQLSAPQGKET